MTPKERLNLVQRAGLCVNCLKHGHKAKTCSSSNCTKCKKRHNSLLHLGSTETPTTTSQTPLPTITTTVGSSTYQSVPVLLSTARVYLTDANGDKHECRALLDSGSQANFISKNFAKQLCIPMSMRMTDIEGIGQTQSKCRGRMNLQLSSRHTGFEKRIEALVMPKIVSTQPAKNIDKSAWKMPSNIKLADTTFDKPGRIDLLIGAGLFYSLLSVGQISLGPGCPILQNTLLGWVVGGECKVESTANLYCGVGVADAFSNELEKFWQVEEVEANSNSVTTNEGRCEDHFLPLQPPIDKGTLEIRQNVPIISTVIQSNSPSIFETVNHKNSLYKFQRIIAYAQRFITNCKMARNNNSTQVKSSGEHAQFVATPSACEMQDALQLLIKISQRQDFAEELKSLQQKKWVEPTSKISSLAAFIDEKGIIRVGGRLEASNLAYDAKHQMLLSYHHPLTKLIFENMHKEHLHIGIQGLLAIVRQRFWPLRGKNIARATIHGCIFCTRAKRQKFNEG